jgi:tetrapyrrole methylase family protein/MazG family protein
MEENLPNEPDIIILGLGPGDPELLTVFASRLIGNINEIYIRTMDHPTIKSFPEDLVVHSFDHLYEEEEDYEGVYLRICNEIISKAKEKPGLVYAVPGDPFTAETTPALIIDQANKVGLKVKVVPGVSFLEPTFAALRTDPLPQLSIIDALELRDAHHPPFPPDKPAIIVQIFSREVASDIKLILMNNYPDNHPVILIHDAGSLTEKIEPVPLYQIDRSRSIGNRTTLYLHPLEQGTSLESFQEIIARLRAPDGCPWDREQDHQSLRPNLLEECFEVLEAIDRNDPLAMREEFGDLLLQIVLHAQIATEFGEFNMSEIIQGIYEKIIKRHPHVFEDLALEDKKPETVIRNWEKIKAGERELNGEGDSSILDGVPGSLPALTQAETYQKRAARIGFDWDELGDVLKKLPEEIEELSRASNPKEIFSELGDILFTLVNIARWMGVDAESALREANQRFRSRFVLVEKEARANKRELSSLSLKELEELWEDSKSNLED